MNYTKINSEIEKAALAQPNVNTYTEGDVYENWHKNIKYSAVNMGLESATRTGSTIVYNVILYYADRATSDNANKLNIYDDGINVIQSILDAIPDEIGYATPIEYTPFEQSFEDVLVGCYARISLECEYDLGRCGL